MKGNWSIQFLIAAALLMPGLVASQTTNLQNPYHVIAERNAFALKTPPPPPAPASIVEPLEDLVLTGLIEIENCREALFTLTEPAKPPSYFTMREGAQNQWLEVRSVNSRQGTAKIVLKKPVARSRVVGVEVELSFRTNGQKNRTVALNRGNPHVDFPGGP